MRRIFTFFIGILLFTLAASVKVNAQHDCSCWQQRDTSFHYVPITAGTAPYYRNDDGSTNLLSLPFTFCFWGQNETSVYINNNGNITFGAPYSTYSPDTFPQISSVVPAMIAPYWGDVDTRLGVGGSDELIYKITPHYMIVQWDSVGYYAEHTDKTCSFQLIISDGTDPIIPLGNNVEYCYRQMQWTTGDASLGSGGFGGYPSNIGANEGDAIRAIQIGLFDNPSATYVGQYPPAPNYDGVAWLNAKSFLFNLCSGSVAPLVSGVTSCDTFKVCLGDSIIIPIYFLAPLQGDTVWSNIFPPIPPGVSIVGNYPGPTDSMFIKVVGIPGNYGYNVINVYGYDNQIPSDTTFIPFVVEVDSVPLNISVKAIPDSICQGDTSTLTASGGNLYFWSTGQTTSSIKVAPPSTQTYTVSVSDGGCYKDTSITVHVFSANSITIVARPDTTCPHDSVLLIGNGGTSYIWSTGQTTDSIWVIPDSTSTYSVSASNGLCTASASKIVYVPRISATAIIRDSIICRNDTSYITVVVTGGSATYLWSNGATTSSISVSIADTGTTTFSVNIYGLCDSLTLSKTVTVVPVPKPVITGKDSVCSGTTDTLTVSGGATYLWSTGATTSTITVTVTSNRTITVMASDGSCSHDTTFNIIDVSTSASIVASRDSACAGDTVKLVGSGGISYLWSTGNVSPTIIVRPTVPTTYTLYTYYQGCTDSAMVTIGIIKQAVATLTASPDSVCPGTNAVLTATLSAGLGTLKWSTGATGSSITVNDSVTTTYTVTVNGKCDTVPYVITHYVIPLPKPLITGASWRCKGTKDTLTVTSSTSPTTYKWQNGDSTNVWITGDIYADSTFIVTATNKLGCSVNDTFKVTLRTPPVVTISKPPLACTGLPIEIVPTVSGTGPFTYSWAPNGETTDSISVASPPDSTSVTYTAYVSNGCTTPKTVTISAEFPVLTAIGTQTVTLVNDTLSPAYATLWASGNSTVYFWQDSILVTCINPNVCDTVRVSPSVTTTYTVTGFDKAGCEVTGYVTVVVEVPCLDFKVPNVFTPNYPGPYGRDDHFFVETENISGWSITIFDRWGKTMYNSTDVHKPWDGTNENGDAAADGVYYYVITGVCQNNTYKKEGFVQLIR